MQTWMRRNFTGEWMLPYSKWKHSHQRVSGAWDKSNKHRTFSLIGPYNIAPHVLVKLLLLLRILSWMLGSLQSRPRQPHHPQTKLQPSQTKSPTWQSPPPAWTRSYLSLPPLAPCHPPGSMWMKPSPQYDLCSESAFNFWSLSCEVSCYTTSLWIPMFCSSLSFYLSLSASRKSQRSSAPSGTVCVIPMGTTQRCCCSNCAHKAPSL